MELIALELEAMHAAHTAIWPLNDASQRRAIMWLTAKLGIDPSELDSYSVETGREAISAAEELANRQSW